MLILKWHATLSSLSKSQNQEQSPPPPVYNSHKQGYEDYFLEITSIWLWQGLVLKYLRVVTLEDVKNKLLLLEFFSQKLLSVR